jgi:hypothetical protein
MCLKFLIAVEAWIGDVIVTEGDLKQPVTHTLLSPVLVLEERALVDLAVRDSDERINGSHQKILFKSAMSVP